ncbi:MAG TPA: phosphohydrolase [Microscillaceae bacterium]|nr:phosphohydrolase [Microscillaceae bacterium]
MNKLKIINDPVYGFVKINTELLFDLIEHPYFQRLRRIKQLGLAELVYPGALHTRFHHALGAMHLMGLTLSNLRMKGFEISDEEMEAAQIAILLHDVGHGPMSHALESTILQEVPHEQVSLLLMKKLNEAYKGALDLAIAIFEGKYHRPFFHQLVSSQLDLDRMDYLQRDCYFTGVLEGTIGADRIIKMLYLHQDELVVEEKGIYSIENFLTARRLMYWQVYLHKTNLAADTMLTKIIRRAKWLVQSGISVEAPAHLLLFLQKNVKIADFDNHTTYLEQFATLDDYDIWAAIKQWATHQDEILSLLCQHLLHRKLFKITLSAQPITQEAIHKTTDLIQAMFPTQDAFAISFLFESGKAINEAYLSQKQSINILQKNGQLVEIAQASDLPNIEALKKPVTKYYLCWLNA